MEGIAVHSDPIGRARANFVIFARLGTVGGTGGWEQLWARQVGPDLFEICCIPFFLYGFALGDVVRTHPGHGRQWVVADVVTASGNAVVRLWLRGSTAKLGQVLAEAKELGLPAEISGEHLVAVSVRQDQRARVALWTKELTEKAGVMTEDG